ncbi:hypothetical protein FRC07_007681 [Ceratobasidium sp. 392]|nr:hypothetical protein FRC07_007681 [Ceratobasidium sp. 392]
MKYTGFILSLSILCIIAQAADGIRWVDIKPSGKNDAQRLVNALKTNTHVRVRRGRTLEIETVMNTTSLRDVHFRLEGTLRVQPNLGYWSGNAFPIPYQNNSAIWLFGGENIVIDGGGTIDGSGQTWWDARPGNATLIPPLTLVVYQARNARISNITFYKQVPCRFMARQTLTFYRTPKWANLVQESQDVVYEHITVSSVSNSTADMRETDGWDTYRSDGVTIRDSAIHNGDDCVSFKPNSTNIIVRNLQCHESHGISVGSLGEINGVKDIVRNIYTFAGQNRGYGIVNNIVYTNFRNQNNDYPIDNCYKTSVENCTAYPSGIKINNVLNVTGTSSGKYNATVASLVCSPEACGTVYLQDIDLSPPPSYGPAAYRCLNLNITGPSAGLFNCTNGGVIESPYPT